MSEPDLCPKRERMSMIRSERRDAGFCEVNVWVPVEYARLVRDIAWRIVDLSKRSLPFRGPRRNHGVEMSNVNALLRDVMSESQSPHPEQDQEERP